jgi:protein-S-isoprenylcysteine O-methyltransferase Ste14
MPNKLPDHSGVVVPPPFFYLVFFALGVGLQRYLPLPYLPASFGRPMAILLALLGLVLVAWSFTRFWSAGTSVVPVRPTTAFVVTGPYRFTRNPIYLGTLLLYVGLAFNFRLLWPLVLVPVLIPSVNVWVIRREEQYLERKFGDEYRRYRARVRRWV